MKHHAFSIFDDYEVADSEEIFKVYWTFDMMVSYSTLVPISIEYIALSTVYDIELLRRV